MAERDYRFTVIIPVYNVAQYLAEAVDSVLAQTVGFAEAVQIILVNDGSTDDSESVCLAYRDRFPDNIVYVSQENAGVSAARNTGLAHARGELINFLDGDDRWETDAFEVAEKFLAAHEDVEVVAGRIRVFGAISGVHPLDLKFDGDRVVDVREHPEHSQFHVNSVFIRRAALEGATFEPRLRIGEDLRFITPVILRNGRYGLLGSAVYWYRRRHELDSLVNKAASNRSWYLDTPPLCYGELFDYSKQHFGEVLPFVQHAVMYDLQARLKRPVTDVLSEQEAREYRDLIAGLFSDIDDDVILSQRHLVTEFKLYALALRHGRDIADIRRSLAVDDDGIRWGDTVLRSLRTRSRVAIERLDRHAGSVVIEGRINTFLDPDDLALAFRSGKREVAARLSSDEANAKFSLGDRINAPVRFAVEVPLGRSAELMPRLSVRGNASPVLLAWEGDAGAAGGDAATGAGATGAGDSGEAAMPTPLRTGAYVLAMTHDRITVTADQGRLDRYANELRFAIERRSFAGTLFAKRFGGTA